MQQIFDHTYHLWAKDNISANGAVTYSQDLVANQVPELRKALKGKNVIISTASKLNVISKFDLEHEHYDMAIQYLHTYPYGDPKGYIRKIVSQANFTASKWVFMTAYKPFEQIINDGIGGDFHAVYTPMSIDIEQMPQRKNFVENSVVYFGNLYMSKTEVYDEVRKFCRNNNIMFNTIAFSQLNNNQQKLTQMQAWEIVGEHEYGIGVGRCALEMMAMGLKVFIFGQERGGIMVDEDDWRKQQAINMNGRITTYDRTFEACWHNRKNIFLPNVADFAIGNKKHCLYLQEKGLI